MSADSERPAPAPTFAHDLRRLRLAAELTQRDLAVRSGISARAISDLERGINRSPQRETARMLGDALGLTPEARDQFLALARRRPQPTTLPSSAVQAVDLDPLIGRVQELALIEAAILRPGSRLVTLTGPGGVGKTRLAMEVARRFGTNHPGGVPLLRLEGLHDATLVIPTLAAAVNAPASGDARMVHARIAAQLSAGNRLVILDNLEHLLAAAPELGDVLRMMAGGCLLVTSREALQLAAEQVIPIQSFPLPDAKAWRASAPSTGVENPALQLFVRRARAQRAGLALDTNSDAGQVNLAVVADLCRRLDGLPLAIELAAAWVRVLSCREIVTEIEAGLEFNTTTLHDLPDRHRSMRAVFDHSWQLLSVGEQEVFARCSVFRGGFTREAAANVAGASLTTLSGLIDKSLLGRDPHERYVVHELARQYAAERLAVAQAVDETRDRHLNFYMTLAETAELRLRSGPDIVGW
ncbi:MAG: XRE family transcriptional regulator, partial [Thermomicrobiales bacterium]|nr:XRE family transcriptional regulator [Thermomicrobiales bacterium]